MKHAPTNEQIRKAFYGGKVLDFDRRKPEKDIAKFYSDIKDINIGLSLFKAEHRQEVAEKLTTLSYGLIALILRGLNDTEEDRAKFMKEFRDDEYVEEFRNIFFEKS